MVWASVKSLTPLPAKFQVTAVAIEYEVSPPRLAAASGNAVATGDARAAAAALAAATQGLICGRSGTWTRALAVAVDAALAPGLSRSASTRAFQCVLLDLTNAPTWGVLLLSR